MTGKNQPQSHRGHRGCTEKKLKLRHYPRLEKLDLFYLSRLWRNNKSGEKKSGEKELVSRRE
jgi:hypothetical protein